MNNKEAKRAAQATEVLSSPSRTAGEKAAAQSILDGLDVKVAARTKIARAYGLIKNPPPVYDFYM